MKSGSNLKQKFARAVVGGAAIAGLMSASNAFALPAFPSSGNCAVLANAPVPYGATVPFTTDFNVIAVLTFTSATTGTISFNMTRVTYSATGYTMAPQIAANSGTNLPMTIAPAAGAPAGVMDISFTPPGNATPSTFTGIAVNNGATILMQGKTSPFAGVCQF